MNKIKNTLVLSLLSIFAFAGGDGSGWGDVPDEVSVNSYAYGLVAIAVLMIAYVAYNKRQAKNA